ncbi:MAG: hypothetical protein IPJ85_03755 [Flavobacteriales bacterium]|nr:hypothetical protein [Flavobacteriales bacterium]
MIRSVVFVAAALLLNCAAAQSWRKLGNGAIGPGDVKTIFGDPVSDRLLIGGTFIYMKNETDTVLGIGQAAWNGHRWDSLAYRIQPLSGNVCQQTFWYLRFQDRLYACGGFTIPDGIQPVNSGIARLNEETMRWERLECHNPFNSSLLNLVPKDPNGNSIYLTGIKNTVCGYPQSCVFRYDGSAFHEWEPWSLIPESTSNWTRFVFEFRGYTYLTGSFRDPFSSGFVSFLRWNGSEWEYVPGWGAYSRSINDMSIRNDTLYVSGNFRVATGGPGNCIAYFDGENWNDMGGGVSFEEMPSAASCLVMQWYRNSLWVSGQMDHAGGIPIDGVAKWNGRQWCSVPGDFYDPIGLDRVGDITVWRDSLYVCGGFTSIDGEPIRHVAQWLGGDAVLECSAPVGVGEIEPQGFGLAPNPVRDRMRLNGNNLAGARYEISDATGRLVRAGQIQRQRGGCYHAGTGQLPIALA